MLKLWAEKGEFPVNFRLETHFEDQTPVIVGSTLNIFSGEIKALFDLLSESLCDVILRVETGTAPAGIESAVDGILAGMGIRGVLTMMGLRKTVGSADMIIPHRVVLETKFDQPCIILTPEELKTKKSIPKLSVGGRALSKHAPRSSEVRPSTD